ncbi:MAG: hypothetical protein DWQ18_06440 [Crenarchaeota archaeon]|nr:MAG: hypothetical protein DWQ17_03345 [Thermoproteota archaeon]RDJ33411.1 MAG: hypothetical protein DWQ18_06440 [Thermoproteota archaeon]RDJ38044.1 MAG: hypothetical protein DWQ13_05070 [Thermoproteota archaeon]RDJ38390.1 MAG: hypothetical protein DWQ19_00735 [Thermoproteota archaeon]
MYSKPQALMSVGPMRNFAENAKKISIELMESNEDLAEFNEHLTEYYKQLNETWVEAQKKVNLKIPEIPHDAENYEAYKRVWIDIFDNDFTELFDSKHFGENYGHLVSKELELTKHWNNIMNVVLQSANLPNKQEMDEVYREIHSLRKRVSKLEAKVRQYESKEKGK